MDKEFLTKCVNDGLALYEIADLTGKKWQTIYYYITKYGLQGIAEKKRGKRTTERGDNSISKQLKERHEMGLMPQTPITGKCRVRGEWVSQQEVKEELEYYCDQDLTKDQIGELMGVDNKSVYNWLKKFDMQRPRRKGERCFNWKGGNTKHYRGADWNEQREKALQRDNYVCQDCGMTNEEHKAWCGKSLSVHHIVPFIVEENNDISNLITLCNNCHNKAHASGPYSKGNLARN